MSTDNAMAVDLEIVEAIPDDKIGRGALIPNRIRINGQEVLVPSNTTIDFEPFGNEGAVKVRLSLFVRSLKVGFETNDDGREFRAAEVSALVALLQSGTSINNRDGIDLTKAESE